MCTKQHLLARDVSSAVKHGFSTQIATTNTNSLNICITFSKTVLQLFLKKSSVCQT